MQTKNKRFLMGAGVLMLTFLFYAAGAFIFWSGGDEASVQAVNDVGEPLAVGEVWQEEGLFCASVEDIWELSSAARLLDELSMDKRQAAKEQGLRILALTYTIQPLEGYSKEITAAIRVTAYDEAGESLGEVEHVPVKGRSSGLKRLIFAPPQASRLMITLQIPWEQAQDAAPDQKNIFGPRVTYVYEKNYFYTLP